MDRKQGTVYWITGLAGAGKTTIGRMLYERICQMKNNVVFLDGDVTRQVYNDALGYTREERLLGASRHGRVCKFLSDQGIDVVCCTIGMFDIVREWNRKNILNYWEIFLDVPMEVLQLRDKKNLYSKAKIGKEKDVVGVDLNLEFPKNPDIKIVNDGSVSPEDIMESLCKKIFR